MHSLIWDENEIHNSSILFRPGAPNYSEDGTVPDSGSHIVYDNPVSSIEYILGFWNKFGLPHHRRAS